MNIRLNAIKDKKTQIMPKTQQIKTDSKYLPSKKNS